MEEKKDCFCAGVHYSKLPLSALEQYFTNRQQIDQHELKCQNHLLTQLTALSTFCGKYYSRAPKLTREDLKPIIENLELCYFAAHKDKPKQLAWRTLDRTALGGPFGTAIQKSCAQTFHNRADLAALIELDTLIQQEGVKCIVALPLVRCDGSILGHLEGSSPWTRANVLAALEIIPPENKALYKTAKSLLNDASWCVSASFHNNGDHPHITLSRGASKKAIHLYLDGTRKGQSTGKGRYDAAASLDGVEGWDKVFISSIAKH